MLPKIDTDRMVHLATELRRLDAKAEEIAEQRRKLETELQRLTDEEHAIAAEEGAVASERATVRDELRTMLGVEAPPPPIVYEPPKTFAGAMKAAVQGPTIIPQSVASSVSEAVRGAVAHAFSPAPNGAPAPATNGAAHLSDESNDESGEGVPKTVRARILAYSKQNTIFELEDLVAAGIGTRNQMSSAAHHMVAIGMLWRPSPGVFQIAANRPAETQEAPLSQSDSVLAYARTHSEFTLQEISKAYEGKIGYQSMGTALSVMTRRGLLERTGLGAYRIATPPPEPKEEPSDLRPRDIVFVVARKQHRFSPADVVAASGGRLDANQAAKAMIRMEQEGELVREKRGVYSMAKRSHART